MTLKLFTFRGRHTGKVYYVTGYTAPAAAKTIPIAYKDLELEKMETMPVQMRCSTDPESQN